MTVSRLSLSDFRSYADAVLAPGPGLRHPHRREWRGQDQCAGGGVAALAGPRACAARPWRDGAARTARAASRWRRGSARSTSAPARTPPRPSAARSASTARPASANSLSEWLSVLWLTPAMDRLFADAASGPPPLPRPAGARAPPRSRHPQRPLRSGDARAQQIARRGRAAGTRPGSPRWRRGWPSMARPSPRPAPPTVAALAERLAAAPEGPFARAAARADGRRAGRSRRGPRARDAAAGRTLAGPHRADLARHPSSARTSPPRSARPASRRRC